MARKRRKKQQASDSLKPRTENLSFRELERLMSSANTYERRNGKIKPRRYGQ